MAWYRRDQWPRLRAVAADAEILEETYDQWLALADEAMSKLAREAIKAQTVDIDIDELISWCREQRRPIDQAARAAFASFKLQESAGRRLTSRIWTPRHKALIATDER